MDATIYTLTVRKSRKLCAVTVDRTNSPKHDFFEISGRAMFRAWWRVTGQTMSRDEHIFWATHYAEALWEIEQAYNKAVRGFYRSTFGRPYTLSAYRISGIVRDEFSELQKTILRGLCQEVVRLDNIKQAHLAMLPKSFMFKK